MKLQAQSRMRHTYSSEFSSNVKNIIDKHLLHRMRRQLQNTSFMEILSFLRYEFDVTFAFLDIFVYFVGEISRGRQRHAIFRPYYERVDDILSTRI